MKKQFTRLIGAFCVSIFLFLISTTGVLGQYCAIPAGSSDPTADYIANVTFAGINQSSGATTYTDYTNVVGAVTPGVTYPFSATPGNGGTWTETIVVYIDWDQSETFDPEERIEIGTCTAAGCASGISYDIEVPFSAVPGETRMRVIDNFSSYAIDPCNPFPGDFEYGEVEDYTIVVESGECTPPTLSYEITNNCEDETYSIVVTVSSLGTSSNATIFHKRSDGVLIGNTGINQFTVGEALPFGGNIPFGVTVRDSIVSGNPICTLIRNLEEEICPAENDEACTATPLVCGEILLNESMTGSTQSIDDACFGAGTRDIWYTFESDGSEHYVIDFGAEVVGPNDWILSLFTGSDCGELTQIGVCVDSPQLFDVTEAGTYYVSVRSYAADGAANDIIPSVSLTCVPFDCPEELGDVGSPCDDNDPLTFDDVLQEDCSCAGIVPVPGQICEVPLEITALPYENTDNTANFFDDYDTADVPPIASGAITNGTGSTTYLTGDEVVYAYTPTQNEVLDITTVNDDNWVSLWVFTGCPFESTVGYHTSTSGATRAIEGLVVEPGTTYYIVVSTWGSLLQSTDYTLSVVSVPFDCPENEANYGTPCDDEDPNTVYDSYNENCECVGIPIAENDELCDAATLICGETVTQSYLGASPSPEGSCADGVTNDIWYQFTAEEGITYQIDIVSTVDGVFDSYSDVEVLVGEAGADCNSELTEYVECGIYLSIYADEVATYFVRAQPTSTQTDLEIRLSCYVVPDNIECETATELVCGQEETGATSAGLQRAADQQFCGTSTIPSEFNTGVWYTYESDVDVLMSFDLSGSGFNTMAFLYSGTCDGLVCESGDDDSGEGATSLLTDTIFAGTTYYLYVTGFGNGRGDFVLNTSCFEACTGTPSAGTVSDMVVCSGSPFDVVATDATDDVWNVEFVLQSSAPGENVWTDIATSNSANITVADGITEATDYRIKATCLSSDESDFSNVMAATINPVVTECYCTPEATNAARYINDFSTTNGTQNITNIGSGFSAEGYGDFTEMTVSQMQTDEVSFSDVVVGGTAGFRIWVDWNQDGSFDTETEVAWNSTAYANSHSGSFVVPQNALPGMTRMRIVSHWLSQTGLVDPCVTGFTYGEFEDYSFEVIALPGCAGTPSAGVADVDQFEICATAELTLNVDGASEAATALVRNWQSSPAGADVWTDIDGAITPTYVLADGISEATDFRYVVTCENSNETDISNVIQATINTNVTECYCTPEGTNAGRYINDFSTTNGSQNVTNNASGFSPGGYGDFTAMTVSQLQTQAVNFSGTFVGGTFGFRIWVDWNQDGSFDTDTEVAWNSTSYATTHTGSFLVPQTALAGTTRMRIVASWSPNTGDVDPCITGFANGEFEDYTFDVIALPTCAGAPSAGVADTDQVEICATAPLTLSVSGASEPATGLTSNWQSSPAGSDVWTDIDGAIAPTYVITNGITEATDFRYVVSCEFSDESDISNVIEATINTNVTECYCIPTATNAARFVNNFSTTGANQNVANLASGFSVGGYGDFTSMTVEQSVGGTVNFTTDISGGTAGFRIWVDWNQDGAFDITEEVAYASTAYASSQSGSFTVPANALPGMTRMRIVSHWLNGTGLVDPCITGFTYGEFEDYSFNVSASSSVSLNGTVTWNSNCGDRAATVKLYEPNTANMVASYDVTVASDGSYSIDDVATGTFDIIVKVSGYLAKGTEDVVIAGGVNNLASGAIIGGDIIDNNSINIADISALTLAYGTAPGDANYNPLANLDCAGGVAISDVSALTLNYGLAGDSAPLGN